MFLEQMSNKDLIGSDLDSVTLKGRKFAIDATLEIWWQVHCLSSPVENVAEVDGPGALSEPLLLEEAGQVGQDAGPEDEDEEKEDPDSWQVGQDAGPELLMLL